MRELKFRAWDKKEKKMFDVLGINWYDSIVTESYPDSWVDGFSPGIEHELKDCELMQYTGMKDKQGKEIYEGDILLYEIWASIVSFGEYSNGKPYEEAQYGTGWYLHGSFRKIDDKSFDKRQKYPPDNKDVSIITQEEADESEVIGNIYENPELLENKES